MHTWNLAAGDPLFLTLAADARLTTLDYSDDQIWDLSLNGGEPAALALSTSYGLRAHWMRIFPRFVRGDASRADPASFHVPPRITRVYPNYCSLVFQPFEGIEVEAEYWIPESHIAAGRIKLSNLSILPQAFRLELVGLLNPIDRQGGMVPTRAGPAQVLAGETAYLAPVICLTGGPQGSASPYQALTLDLELYPGSARQFSWAAAALRTYDDSLEAARAATARPWEAELARIELINRSQAVDIETGSPDWDAALALSQNAAFELLFNNKDPLVSGPLPETSFVLTRRSDQGFSLRGDGSEHSYLWNGQTALDSYYLASLLLPGAPELAAGLVRNMLATQDEAGFVDMKPGLGGQRSHRLAQPVLATLAEQVAPYLDRLAWYREVFPGLLRFFNQWFAPAYDQDGDGFPEWEHPVQTGLEDSPIYDRWSPNAQGIEIQRMESPALAAMLLRECQSLIAIAGALEQSEQAEAAYARLSGGEPTLSGASEALPGLRDREAALRAQLQSAWDEPARIYHYRDYQTHLSPTGQILAEFDGSGRNARHRRFPQPRRLLIHVDAAIDHTHAVTVTIQGFNETGEVSETIPSRSFTWMNRQGRATTQTAFAAIRHIEVDGLAEDEHTRVMTADYTQEDCALFLPLWAGAPDADTAQKLVEDTLATRYLQASGIPVCPPDMLMQEELPGMHTALTSALLPWNQLIGEGLLRYGYQKQAADLVTRLMDDVVTSLKTGRAFRQYYQAETGAAGGERGHLHGLAPLGLFLQTLGLRQLAPKEILLDGFNPYPWTIHVKYRKVELTFFSHKTEIQFPGGQQIILDQPGLHRVTLD